MTYLPIQYEEPIFRPPSEADSILLPVTIGCSHNKCSYCAMYQTKKYRIRSWHEIVADLGALQKFFKGNGEMPSRFFLCDGDAMSADTELLIRIASLASDMFGSAIDRFSVYANVSNIMKKSHEELVSLRMNKINLAYIGMESGWDPLLSMVQKGHTAEQLIEACRSLRAAGIRISLIVMIGLAGTEGSSQHAIATARVLSEIVPEYLSFLVTTPIPGTTYQRQVEKGLIKPLSSSAIFGEMMAIVEGLSLPAKAKVIFRANHVSNLMPLRGDLPLDRLKLVATLEHWMKQCPKDSYPELNPRFL